MATNGFLTGCPTIMWSVGDFHYLSQYFAFIWSRVADPESVGSVVYFIDPDPVCDQGFGHDGKTWF